MSLVPDPAVVCAKCNLKGIVVRIEWPDAPQVVYFRCGACAKVWSAPRQAPPIEPSCASDGPPSSFVRCRFLASIQLTVCRHTTHHSKRVDVYARSVKPGLSASRGDGLSNSNRSPAPAPVLEESGRDLTVARGTQRPASEPRPSAIHQRVWQPRLSPTRMVTDGCNTADRVVQTLSSSVGWRGVRRSSQKPCELRRPWSEDCSVPITSGDAGTGRLGRWAIVADTDAYLPLDRRT